MNVYAMVIIALFFLTSCSNDSSSDIKKMATPEPVSFPLLHNEISVMTSLVSRGADLAKGEGCVVTEAALRVMTANLKPINGVLTLNERQIDLSKDDVDNLNPMLERVRVPISKGGAKMATVTAKSCEGMPAVWTISWLR